MSEQRKHQDAYIDGIASAMAERLDDAVEWIDLRRALGRSLGSNYVIVLASQYAAADAVGAVGVSETEAKKLVVELGNAIAKLYEQRTFGNVDRFRAAEKKIIDALTKQPAAPTSDGATGGEN